MSQHDEHFDKRGVIIACIAGAIAIVVLAFAIWFVCVMPPGGSQ